MRYRILVYVFCFMILASARMVHAEGFQDSAKKATAWLEQTQNADGSWGDNVNIKPLYTTESVLALRSFYKLSPSYYWGIAWLENHKASNNDYKSRLINALLSHGDDIRGYRDDILASIRTSSSESGWGLSTLYDSSPLDTAISLKMLKKTNWPDYGEVLQYLKSSQNPDGGWSVSKGTQSDAATTTLVVQTLRLYQSTDNTLNNPIQNAETYLNNNVNTGSSPLLKSNAVLAFLPNSNYLPKVNDLMNSLLADQGGDGAWGSDAYTTATIVRTLSAYTGFDPEAKDRLCDVTDENLRGQMNEEMGKNSGDSLSLGEMESVTELNAQGTGIKDLTGIGCASNLTRLDLRDNQITSLAPLMNLPNLFSIDILLDGNPLSNSEDTDGDGISDLAELLAGSNPLDSESVPTVTPVPAVGFYGQLVIFLSLLLMALRVTGSKKNANKLGVPMKAAIFLIMLMLFVSTGAISAEKKIVTPVGLSSEELINFRNISQAILVSNTLEKKRIEGKRVEDQKSLNQIRETLIEMETELKKELFTVSGASNGSSKGFIMPLSEETNPVKIVIEPDTIPFNPSDSNLKKDLSSQPQSTQKDYTKQDTPITKEISSPNRKDELVSAQETHAHMIDQLFERSISKISEQRKTIEDRAIAKAKTGKMSNKQKLLSKFETNVLNTIKMAENELKTMRTKGPDLKKIQTLINRLSIREKQKLSEKPKPTFTTLMRHR
nr:hypothetical protein [Desulfobacula sp.]